VVPLIGIIIYAAIILMSIGALNGLAAGLFNGVESALQWIVEALAGITLRIVHISESLPFAQLTDSYITEIQLLLLISFIYLFARFLFTHRPQPLIIALASLFAFQTASLLKGLDQPVPQLVVFNSSERSEIALFAHDKRYFMKIPDNGVLPHPQKRILRLSDNAIASYEAEEPFQVDVLVLSLDASFQVEQLLTLFNPAVIVLDSSLPRRTATRMRSECNRLGIEVHDVTQNGAYSVNY
jgi:competence protein ComEC